MHKLKTRLIAIAAASLACLTFGANEATAASKQGGGAFSKPAPAKLPKKTVKPRAPAPKAKPVAVNYDGSYTGRFILQEDRSPMPCWSGSRQFEIRNNKASIQIFPLLGDTVGGDVVGNSLKIGLLRSGGLPNPWNWRGSLVLPASRGQKGTGTLLGRSDTDPGCTWALEVTRN